MTHKNPNQLDSVSSVRVIFPSECVTEESECSHAAHTDSETLANKGKQSRASDTQTGAQ